MSIGRAVHIIDTATVSPVGCAGRHLAWLVFVAWGLAPVVALAQDAQWESLIDAANSAYQQGDFRGALEKAEEALSVAGTFGEKDPRYIRTLVELGVVNRRLGHLGLAESYYQRALRLYEETLGPNHQYVAAVLSNLGVIRDTQRRYREAEEYYRRALSIDEQVYGPDHVNIGSDLHNLAAVYYATGRSDEAELAFKRVLSIYEKAGETNNHDFAITLKALGILYFDKGRYTDAESLLQQALRLYEALYGSDHKQVWNIQSTLADIERRQGGGSTADSEKGTSER